VAPAGERCCARHPHVLAWCAELSSKASCAKRSDEIPCATWCSGAEVGSTDLFVEILHPTEQALDQLFLVVRHGVGSGACLSRVCRVQRTRLTRGGVQTIPRLLHCEAFPGCVDVTMTKTVDGQRRFAERVGNSPPHAHTLRQFFPLS